MSHRRVLLLSGITIGILLLGLLVYFGIQSQDLSRPFGRGGAFLMTILTSLFCLLALVFFVVRALIKLYLEKKQNKMGHGFKTKLVTIFVLLVSVPGTVLFVLTSWLVTSTVEKWYAFKPIQDALESSREIGAFVYSLEKQETLKLALRLALENRPAEIQKAAPEGYSVRLVPPLGPGIEEDVVVAAQKGIPGVEIDSHRGRELVRAAVPYREGDAVTHVIVVEKELPPDLVGNLQTVRSVYQNNKTLESKKDYMKAGYFLAMAVVTLFVVFMVLWAALHVAQNIIRPLQTLAEGTRRVAEGHLDTQLEVLGRDEFGILTSAFNQMVSELKSGQERLKSAYSEMDRKHYILTSIINNIASGVICTDTAGNILLINNAACSILGIAPGALRNLTTREILEPVESSELRAIIQDVRQREFSGRTWEIRASIRGRPAILRLFVANLRETTGQVSGVLVVFDDITELIKAQRAYAWQEVARRMAHEIKNPLTPIKLSAERLLKKHRERAEDLDSVLESSMNTITREVESLRRLVNEFSRFGKLPELKLEPVDLPQMIGEIASLYQGFRDIELAVDTPADLPRAPLDREQVRRVLINLLDNAVEAMGRRGRIVISSAYEPARDILRIEVADEGPGIRPEDRDRLFLPHFSTKKSGTGLGLAIVQKIVSDHRGAIRVEDNKPKGARFVIEFPVTLPV